MSGARLALTLALELRRRGGGVGAAALCGGGGQGDALMLAGPAAMSPDATGPATERRLREPGRRGAGGRSARRRPADHSGGDGRPGCRELAAALAPYTGQAQVIGLTGSPGVGKSTTDQRPGRRRYRAQGPPGGGAGRRPVQPVHRRRHPRRPGADAGPRHRPRRLHPFDVHPRAPGRARRGDPAGGPGARRGRLRRGARRDGRGRAGRGRGGGAGRHHAGAARAGHGRRASRRSKAGILEIADVFVVNKADRDGADATVPRHPGHDRPGERAPGEWRPRWCATVAARGEGIDEVVAAIDQAPGLAARARSVAPRAASSVPPRRWRVSWCPGCARRCAGLDGGSRLATLAARVAAGQLDPYAAGAEVLAALGHDSSPPLGAVAPEEPGHR